VAEKGEIGEEVELGWETEDSILVEVEAFEGFHGGEGAAWETHQFVIG